MISSTTPKLIYVYNLRLTLYSCLLFLEEGKYDSVACMLLCGAVRKSFPVHLAQLVFFVLIHGFIFSGLLPEKKKKKKNIHETTFTHFIGSGNIFTRKNLNEIIF